MPQKVRQHTQLESIQAWLLFRFSVWGIGGAESKKRGKYTFNKGLHRKMEAFGKCI